ncbi:MAG TPA: HAD-IA family hydrolase [Candidatus Paceibacterota bacterium]|nr:HAD-IA family hydrolase [Candidatus Paceibacterota bacterium]
MKKAVIFDMYGVLLRRNGFIFEREDRETVALVKELKAQGVKLFLLSNIYVYNAQHFIKKYPSLALFDKLYFSSDTGFAKPDRQAYEQILEENDLEAEECVFFDDKAVNVEGACALGIEAYVFKDARAAREKVL